MTYLRVQCRPRQRITNAVLGLLLLVASGCVAPDPSSTPSAPDITRPALSPPILKSDTAPPTPHNVEGPLTTDQLVIDAGTQLQTITGLGINANVHSWKGGQLKAAIDKYASLGPLMWRVIIEKDDWESSEVGAADTINWSYYDNIYASPKLEDLWDTIAYIESKPGQSVTLSLMGGVPTWMGGTRIREDKEDYWVRMVSSLVAYGREKRTLKLNLVSPLNEPDLDGIEGPKVNPDQAVRLFDKLGRRLDAMGLADVRFIAPDTSSADGARTAFLPALLSDPYVVSKIAHLGVHTYSGDVDGLIPSLSRTPLAASEVWVTEFNAPCDGCDTDSAPADTWNRAQATAIMLVGLLSAGVSGAQLYDAWDSYYEHHAAVGHWGALAYDSSSGTYSPRRSFDVLDLIYSRVPDGSVHVKSSGASALTTAAFTDPTKKSLTILGINGTSSSQRFRASLSGAGSFSTAQISTLTENGLSTSQASVDGANMVASVTAYSVFVINVR